MERGFMERAEMRLEDGKARIADLEAQNATLQQSIALLCALIVISTSFIAFRQQELQQDRDSKSKSQTQLEQLLSELRRSAERSQAEVCRALWRLLFLTV
jgi:hypothetical protein